MKLQLESISDHTQTSIEEEYIDLVVPTIEDMKKKEHNQEMLEIASALNYVKFDDIKGCLYIKDVEILD